MRTGLMGGSFDPIHKGHIHIAETAKDALSLDVVLFIPVGTPPHKALNAGAGERLEMVRLAVDGLAWAEASAVESERVGMTYTVDTLAMLTETRPGDRFYYILGTDALRDMPLWRNARKAMEYCELAAVTRPGYNVREMEDAKHFAEEELGATVHVVWDEDGVDGSSSLVRELAAAGKEIGKYVPEKVEKYIKERGLYQSNSKQSS